MKYKIKSILLAIYLIITGCLLTACETQKVIGKVKIPLIEYSQEQRNELADKLDEINSQIVDKFISDYKNLRDKVRSLNEN